MPEAHSPVPVGLSTPASHTNCSTRHPPSVVRGLVGETIVRRADELQGGELLLAELRGCTIFVLGTVDALWMYDLLDCRVLGGPIRGATFIDGAGTVVA